MAYALRKRAKIDWKKRLKDWEIKQSLDETSDSSVSDEDQDFRAADDESSRHNLAFLPVKVGLI